MLRKTLLELLYETHWSAKKKCRAKSIFYWPDINSDIINVPQSCNTC